MLKYIQKKPEAKNVPAPVSNTELMKCQKEKLELTNTYKFTVEDIRKKYNKLATDYKTCNEQKQSCNKQKQETELELLSYRLKDLKSKSPQQKGGDDQYYAKYLKYKTKYLNLKNFA